MTRHLWGGDAKGLTVCVFELCEHVTYSKKVNKKQMGP